MYHPRELLHELVAPVRGTSVHHKRLHQRVVAIIAATVVIDVIATLLIFSSGAFEGKPPHEATHLQQLGDSAVWATSQLLAGGSSLDPGSRFGHVLEVGLELWGITIVAALAGSIATFLLQHDNQRSQESSSTT